MMVNGIFSWIFQYISWDIPCYQTWPNGGPGAELNGHANVNGLVFTEKLKPETHPCSHFSYGAFRCQKFPVKTN